MVISRTSPEGRTANTLSTESIPGCRGVSPQQHVTGTAGGDPVEGVHAELVAAVSVLWPDVGPGERSRAEPRG